MGRKANLGVVMRLLLVKGRLTESTFGSFRHGWSLGSDQSTIPANEIADAMGDPHKADYLSNDRGSTSYSSILSLARLSTLPSFHVLLH